MKEIVIKIPDEDYKKLNNPETIILLNGDILGAIKNGIPLPKGHGRLIDADKLWDLYHDLDYDFYEAIHDITTIIEADKE